MRTSVAELFQYFSHDAPGVRSHPDMMNQLIQDYAHDGEFQSAVDLIVARVDEISREIRR